MKVVLPLLKVLTLSAKSVLVPLVLTAAASATNTAIQKYIDIMKVSNLVVFIQEIACLIASLAQQVHHLDEYKLIGSHWVAFYVNSNKVTYFGSFRDEYIPKEINTFVSDENIIANIYRNKVKIR